MSESVQHKQYIDRIYKYTLNLIPENHSRLILIDGDDHLRNKDIPPLINGFRPDLYYEFDSILILGEAKTRNDYATKHSVNQYREYYKHCAYYQGVSYIILSCPWTCSADLKTIIRKIKQEYKNQVKVIFLDEMSGD